jgi:crotonobetainyl-CoA:carnitine CoA-transferase CaiB-like acyl-CoA transferase
MTKLGGVLPIAPVNELDDALEAPFVASRMVSHVPHPARPGMRVLANPIKINGKRLSQKACPPAGADNDILPITGDVSA